jgi:hypothetical protein
MKKITTSILCFVMLLATQGFSQITWNFGTATTLSAYPTSGIPANVTVDSIRHGNSTGTPFLATTSASAGYTGATGAGNAGVTAKIGPLDYTVNASTGSAFYEITLTPDAGYYLNITNISFGSRSTATGPKKYSIRTSLNSYMTEVAGDTINSAASAWGLRTKPLSITGTVGTQIKLRIYGYLGAGAVSAINFRIDDLKITATAILAPPTVTLQPTNENVCEGTEAGFNIYSNGTNTYQWQVDMGSGFVDVTNDANYSGATTDNLSIADATGMDGYIYHCIVTNGAGSATSNAATLTVSPPVIPTVSIPTSIPPACAGDAATISAVGTNTGSTPTYEWFWVGFGSVGTGATLNVPPGFLPAGTHQIYCELTSNAACATPTLVTSNTLVATVYAAPATPIVSANGNELYTSLYDTYQWYVGSTALGTDSSEVALSSGVYTVVVTNSDGCEATSAPYNFVLTSIASHTTKNELSLYPNPSNGLFTIDLGEVNKKVSITIYNVVGKIISQHEYTNTNKPLIDISNQTNGSYFITIKTDNQTITKKVAINK